MKPLVDLVLAAGVYAFLAGCVVFGIATIALLSLRLWGGSCIAP